MQMNNASTVLVFISTMLKMSIEGRSDYFCPAKTFIMKFKSTTTWRVLLSFIFLLAVQVGIAQCPDNGVFYQDATPIGPGAAGAYVQTCVYGGDLYTCTVVQGDTYNFNTCGTTWNTIITLRNDLTGALIAFNDNGGGCGTGSSIDWVATFSGTVSLQVNTQPGCGTNTTCGTLTVTRTAAVVETCDPLYIGATQAECDGGPVLEITVTGSGTCQINGLEISVDGAAPFTLTLTAPALAGESFILTGAELGSTYSITGILDNGDITNTTSVTVTSDCAVTACEPTFVTVDTDCYGDEVSWILTDELGVVVHEVAAGTFPGQALFSEGSYTTALCLPDGCYTFTINDTFGDGLNPVGTPCTVVGDFSVTLGTGELLVDGDPNYTETATYDFCVGGSVGTCSANSFSATVAECVVGVAEPTASSFFTFDYTGDCTVSIVHVSVDGGAFVAVDVTAFGIVQGVPIEIFLDPGVAYDLYYELSDGTLSEVISLDTPDCLSGETICDCAGTSLPVEATAWLGDGFFDNGSFNWNDDPALPVDFNCATWGFDCDDEGVGNTEDPFGVCQGNLPPGNGCIDVPPTCADVDLIIQFDCYTNESFVSITNELGEIVYAISGDLIDPNTLLTETTCLPTGCYTFTFADSFGDGLSGVECTDPTPGYFEVYSAEGIVLVQGGGDFGDIFTQEFCVEAAAQVCSDLALTVVNGYCTPDANDQPVASITLFPTYIGDCTIETIYISLDGSNFETLDISAEGYGSGSEIPLYNLALGTQHSIFYELGDGSFSEVAVFTTSDCQNEITICDCAGTQHTIGATVWLGDDFADIGEFDWFGQPVDFNCANWGFDCGDVQGAPALDPYGVCDGNLPPNNGCDVTEDILGCTDETALNYNPAATINDGSCIYNAQFGCTDPDACNFNSTAQFDNGSCEYITCTGCTDPDANNYDPTATVDDGSCDYTVIEGCTDDSALNYNPIATEDDGSCIFDCVWPTVSFVPHCPQGSAPEYYVTMTISALGNGAPYIVTNSENQEQYVVNFMGTIEVGPFNNNEQVLITVNSVGLDGCLITSPVLTFNCTNVGVEETEHMDMLSIYPNPSSGMFQIVNKGASEKMTMRVFDQTGKVVFSDMRVMNTGAIEQIDLSGLSVGTYHLEMIGSTTIQNETIMIQK